MKLPPPPKGWTECDPCSSVENRPVKCDNCGWEGYEEELGDRDIWGIADLRERLCPGGVTPVGECPEELDDPNVGPHTCRSLVYYNDVLIVYRKIPNVLERMVEEA